MEISFARGEQEDTPLSTGVLSLVRVSHKNRQNGLNLGT
jgi:hypothetical protein